MPIPSHLVATLLLGLWFHRVGTRLSGAMEPLTYNAANGTTISSFACFDSSSLVPRRYINTDYAFASSIVNDLNLGIHRLLVTYDIACQWGINLRRRLKTYLPPVNINLDELLFRVAIPKLHLVGHGASCQGPYNLALMDGVGLTHGEGVETVWSHSTSLATWSRENGPAARHLILDDHWGGWNWRKVVNLRMCPFCMRLLWVLICRTHKYRNPPAENFGEGMEVEQSPA